MASTSPPAISMNYIFTSAALNTLLQSFNGLLNNPASLYLSATPRRLIIYVLPTHTVNVLSLPYLIESLQQGKQSALGMKAFLENNETTTKVFFDARMSAKLLFEQCGITLANPVRCPQILLP
jgi:hypothetical protein